jgi:hypothetical protein
MFTPSRISPTLGVTALGLALCWAASAASERKANDWMSIVDLRLDDLPTFDPRAIVYAPDLPDVEEPENTQDVTTWRGEAAAIAATHRSIVWRSPSRHEMPHDAAPPSDRDEIFVEPAALYEQLPSESWCSPAIPSPNPSSASCWRNSNWSCPLNRPPKITAGPVPPIPL